MIRKLLLAICITMSVAPAEANSSENMFMDETEVNIEAFSAFAEATGFVSKAEKQGGMVYEMGWTVKPAWNWRQPYGQEGRLDEPAVHLTFSEAEQYCIWKGKRLPTRQEWIDAAYTEQRNEPTDGFIKGKTYPFPLGEAPDGANCLSDCGAEELLSDKKFNYSDKLVRGAGHAPVGVTKRGVNGLYDMGANVWEWASIADEKGAQATMGGSWWYGKRQMRADYRAVKPEDMAAVYIGFRCFGALTAQ